MIKKAIAVGLVFALFGCGGAKQKDTSAPFPVDDESEPSDGSDTYNDTSEPEQTGLSGGGASDDLPGVAVEGGDDWKVSQGDCNLVASHYEKLLEKREMDKLEKRNLKEKARASAEEVVKAAAHKGAQQWLDECTKIVGSVRSHKRWECAAEAPSVEEFDACLKGEEK